MRASSDKVGLTDFSWLSTV